MSVKTSLLTLRPCPEHPHAYPESFDLWRNSAALPRINSVVKR
jgi:hypothetical protein